MPVYQQLLAIVAMVSTQVFMGEELTSNQEWIRTSIEYTVNVMTCATEINKMPPLEAPFRVQDTADVQSNTGQS